MEVAEFVPQLLQLVPISPERYRAENQELLNGWLAGTPKYEDIGRLLLGWSSRDAVARMTAEQRGALADALRCYIGVAATIPRGNAYFAVRVAGGDTVQFPWNDPAFVDHVESLLKAVDAAVVGAGRRHVADALLRIRGRTDIPSTTRELVGHVLTSFEPRVRDARMSVAPDMTLRGTGTFDIKNVCNAFRTLAQRYLDRHRREANERTIARAEQTPTAANLSDLDFLGSLMFGAMHRRYGGLVTRIAEHELAPATAAATHLIQRSLSPNPANRQGIAFMQLVVAFADLNDKSQTPRDIADRFTSKRWVNAFEDAQGAREAIIRFGNDYMQRQSTKGELDGNSVITWLKVYQDLLNEAGGTVDVTLREPLLSAVAIAKNFENDDTVSFLVSLIDPLRAKHPWTAPEALPFLPTEDCKTLEADLRALRLLKVRSVLSDSTTVDAARRYLEQILSDDAYDDFRAPAQSVRAFNAPHRPPVHDARREFEAANPARRSAYHLYRQWYAYSLTGEGGDILMAKTLWEETEDKHRTYEERWNLAVVYCRIGQERRALELLWEPGLKNADAPYDHLRFAASLSLRLPEFPAAAELLRLLPLAAAQIVAYAAAPPADADREIEHFKLIRSLATEPIVSTLDTYPNPRAMRRDLGPFLDTLRKRLVELQLKSTWRIWLTGFLNLYPMTTVAWEMLYQSWTNDDARRGQEVLERMLTAFERWRNHPDLMFFARLYVQSSDPSRVESNLPRLQQMLAPIKEDLQRRLPAVYQKIAGKVPPPPPLSAWERLSRLMTKNFDGAALRNALSLCVGELTRSAPDTTKELVPWEQALDSFVRTREAFATGSVDATAIARLNEWLTRHPASELTGFADRLRPFGDWLHASFSDLVRRESVAPAPALESIPGDPGIAISHDVVSAALVISNPTGLRMKRVTLEAVPSSIVQQTKERLAAFDLDGNESQSVAIPLIVANGFEDVVTVEITARYSWGSVDDLRVHKTLRIGRYRFEQHLAATVKQDFIPYDLFTFDGALRSDNKSFVGRAAEVEQMRRMFALPVVPGVPPYFYGIRRVGKTSLLLRLMQADVLASERYASFYLNMFGVRSNTPLAGVCARLHKELTSAMPLPSSTGVPPPPTDEYAPEYRYVEWFDDAMATVASLHAPRVPVIFVDEFHNLATPQCVPILDLIRKLYQENRVLFVLAGWVGHEVLRNRASESHLFPLDERPINFLSPQEVEDLLHRTFGMAGVHFAPDFVDAIVELTAGHPNLVQKLCGFVTANLNNHKRIVAVSSDLEHGARVLIDDQSQFRTSWYNPDIVTTDEQRAAGEIIAHAPVVGAWVPLTELSAPTRQNIVALIQKQVVRYDTETQRVRVKGLLLDRFLREMNRLDPPSSEDRLNVALFVDYENIEPLFPAGTSAATIAKILRKYVETLGNPRALVVAANWERRTDRFPARNAFRSAGFQLPDASLVSDRRIDKDKADRMIVRAMYDRMLEIRDGSNDAIDVYVVASGDGHYLDYLDEFITKFHKQCRLLASRSDEHLNGAYVDYERARASVSVMRGQAESDFAIDDLTPWIASVTQQQ